MDSWATNSKVLQQLVLLYFNTDFLPLVMSTCACNSVNYVDSCCILLERYAALRTCAISKCLWCCRTLLVRVVH